MTVGNRYDMMTRDFVDKSGKITGSADMAFDWVEA